MFEIILPRHGRGQRVRAGNRPRRGAWGDEPFMPPFTSSRRETTRTAVRWPPFPEILEQGALLKFCINNRILNSGECSYIHGETKLISYIICIIFVKNSVI